MKQMFTVGEAVEVWFEDGRWYSGVVYRVMRCATLPEGQRYFRYKVIFDGPDGERVIAEFEQAHLRWPTKFERTPRKLRAKKFREGN